MPSCYHYIPKHHNTYGFCRAALLCVAGVSRKSSLLHVEIEQDPKTESGLCGDAAQLLHCFRDKIVRLLHGEIPRRIHALFWEHTICSHGFLCMARECSKRSLLHVDIDQYPKEEMEYLFTAFSQYIVCLLQRHHGLHRE